jgi:hypothetical protein
LRKDDADMAVYKKTRKLKPEVASYIAGLIDGEGTVTLSRRHANENRQRVVSIANTERRLLEFVEQATGVGKITRKRTISSRHSPSFAYSVSNRQALSLLCQVVRFMRSYKRERAQFALRCYESLTARNGKYTEASRRLRALFESAFLSTTATNPHFALGLDDIRPVSAEWAKKIKSLVRDVGFNLNEPLPRDDA